MKYNQILILKNELVTDPLTRGYSTMDDRQAAESLNTRDRVVDNTRMLSGSEVLNRVVISEYNALANADKTLLWNILHLSEINPWGKEANLLTGIFGSGSQTMANLRQIRRHTVSRAFELGLPRVYPRDVNRARSI